ncbi:hypothetical protein L1987_53263 [Smallanthus sonchifolius]|uniref:Uncharacterized protein n=1 Tax=Smallanthus sonchifolius TaxID=185202 RepID=A0ACB9EWK6_9ASTR|nr:hypothetical protein L1987_53263 [Smallanthus sonchifolius]
MSKMSYSSASMGSGSRTARRIFEFGRTYVVRPKAKHQATIVWLHGLGDNGSSWSQLLDNLPLPNIKWICPTAPTRPVTTLGGFPCTAWFDEGELSEDGPNDFEGLDASIAHIANLLSTEPSDGDEVVPYKYGEVFPDDEFSWFSLCNIQMLRRSINGGQDVSMHVSWKRIISSGFVSIHVHMEESGMDYYA